MLNLNPRLNTILKSSEQKPIVAVELYETANTVPSNGFFTRYYSGVDKSATNALMRTQFEPIIFNDYQKGIPTPLSDYIGFRALSSGLTIGEPYLVSWSGMFDSQVSGNYTFGVKAYGLTRIEVNNVDVLGGSGFIQYPGKESFLSGIVALDTGWHNVLIDFAYDGSIVTGINTSSYVSAYYSEPNSSSLELLSASKVSPSGSFVQPIFLNNIMEASYSIEDSSSNFTFEVPVETYSDYAWSDVKKRFGPLKANNLMKAYLGYATESGYAQTSGYTSNPTESSDLVHKFTGSIDSITVNQEQGSVTATVKCRDFTKRLQNTRNENFPNLASYTKPVIDRIDPTNSLSINGKYPDAYDSWYLVDVLKDMCIHSNIDPKYLSNSIVDIGSYFRMERSMSWPDTTYIDKYGKEGKDPYLFRYTYGDEMLGLATEVSDLIGYKMFFNEQGFLEIRDPREEFRVESFEVPGVGTGRMLLSGDFNSFYNVNASNRAFTVNASGSIGMRLDDVPNNNIARYSFNGNLNDDINSFTLVDSGTYSFSAGGPDGSQYITLTTGFLAFPDSLQYVLTNSGRKTDSYTFDFYYYADTTIYGVGQDIYGNSAQYNQIIRWGPDYTGSPSWFPNGFIGTRRRELVDRATSVRSIGTQVLFGMPHPSYGHNYLAYSYYTDGALVDDAWNRISVVYDSVAGDVSIHVNSTEIHKSNWGDTPIMRDSNKLWIGGGRASYSAVFSGSIDNLKVYNKAVPEILTPSYSQFVITSGSPTITVPFSGVGCSISYATTQYSDTTSLDIVRRSDNSIVFHTGISTYEDTNSYSNDYLLTNDLPYDGYDLKIYPSGMFKLESVKYYRKNVFKPDYTYRSNEDIISIDMEINDDDLRNEVIAVGQQKRDEAYLFSKSTDLDSIYNPDSSNYTGDKRLFVLVEPRIQSKRRLEWLSESLLKRYNRNNKNITISTVGNPGLQYNDVIGLVSSKAGLDTDSNITVATSGLYVEGVEDVFYLEKMSHHISDKKYTMSLSVIDYPPISAWRSHLPITKTILDSYISQNGSVFSNFDTLVKNSTVDPLAFDPLTKTPQFFSFNTFVDLDRLWVFISDRSIEQTREIVGRDPEFSDFSMSKIDLFSENPLNKFNDWEYKVGQLSVPGVGVWLHNGGGEVWGDMTVPTAMESDVGGGNFYGQNSANIPRVNGTYPILIWGQGTLSDGTRFNAGPFYPEEETIDSEVIGGANYPVLRTNAAPTSFDIYYKRLKTDTDLTLMCGPGFGPAGWDVTPELYGCRTAYDKDTVWKIETNHTIFLKIKNVQQLFEYDVWNRDVSEWGYNGPECASLGWQHQGRHSNYHTLNFNSNPIYIYPDGPAFINVLAEFGIYNKKTDYIWESFKFANDPNKTADDCCQGPNSIQCRGDSLFSFFFTDNVVIVFDVYEAHSGALLAKDAQFGIIDNTWYGNSNVINPF